MLRDDGGPQGSGISKNVSAPSACTGLPTSVNQGIYVCQEWVAHGSNAGPCIRVDFINLKSNHPRGEKRATRDGWNQCLYERQGMAFNSSLLKLEPDNRMLSAASRVFAGKFLPRLASGQWPGDSLRLGQRVRQGG